VNPSNRPVSVPPNIAGTCCARLRVNRKTLYESIRLGQVPGVFRLGKSLRIHRASLVESASPGKGRVSALGSR